MEPEAVDRHPGYLLGLAAGDALGTALEFRRPGNFEPIGKRRSVSGRPAIPSPAC